MTKLTGIKAIAFDADDTLWDNETFFLNVEKNMCEILSDYGDAQAISASLFKTEMANMDDYGYGAMAYTLSLVENAIKVSNGKVSASQIHQILELGRTLLRLDASPLEGVQDTLRQLKETGKYKLVVFTKGELLTQENKLKRSGLLPYFDHVVIVSDKQEPQYRDLCEQLCINPEELLMVGNSLKSDILPALNIGAWAVHIPYEVMWQHEVIDNFDHHRMFQLNQFAELLPLLKIGL
ncbi:MAG: HAD-IA family hydrolase [Salinivirgaceae bacterium]|nr:HAD-IA family hydrolase [Salinivirgaceae bacterium]